MTSTLKTIAVDLTPMLPGGENGGAKIFVLELLRGLIDKHRSTTFVLLTQSRTHDELASLDRANVRRVLVLRAPVEDAVRPSLKRLVARVYPMLPGRVRRGASAVGYRFSNALKRGGAASIVRQVGADLLFCPFTAPIYFEPGVPTVCTIYDLQYKTHPDFFAPEIVAHRDRTFVDACRKATVLTAISDYSRESVLAHATFDPRNVRTIHLRLPQRGATVTEATARETLARFGLTPHGYLIYPANFWQHKNHEMLITAFGMACATGLDAGVKLVCTGAPGERLTWLRDAARRIGLGDRIVFPGYVSHDELAALLRSSIGMVFPSLYEGFGLPVIEAMACAVPVACSDTTSLPEVAGDAAVFFDPRIPSQIADAIKALAGDAALRERIVAAGRVRAAEFSDADRMVSEYWDLFEFAVGNVKPVDALTGVHADGWAGAALTIQVAPGSRTLDVDFFVPDWSPRGKLTIDARRDGRRIAAPIVLQAGAADRWTTPIDEGGGRYELSIGPTFVPATNGMGADTRELSAMVRGCSVTRLDGARVSLYPEQPAA